jgi:hypothetical protein
LPALLTSLSILLAFGVVQRTCLRGRRQLLSCVVDADLLRKRADLFRNGTADLGGCILQRLPRATHCLAKAAADLTDGTTGPECLAGSIRQPADRLTCGPAGLNHLLGGLADIA